MNLVTWVKSGFKSRQVTTHEMLEELRLANESSAGVAVTDQNAMKVSAFFSAVRVITESVASLPLHVYVRKGETKQRDYSNPLYHLLHDQPNGWQTSFEWREMMGYHLIMRGNGYSFVVRDRFGVIKALIPMDPDCVEVSQDELFKLNYVYKPKGKEIIHLKQTDVLHLRGLTLDGFTGVSVLTWAREVLGGAMVMQEHSNRVWRNGANPGVVLEHPQKMSPEAHKRLKEDWATNYTGPRNSAKTVILEEGAKISRLSMTSTDAQFLESRKFSRSEIAGMLRVPPHMIGDLERATFSNMEHQDLGFVKHSLRPWLVRWEQAIQRDLLRDYTRFAEYNVNGLARGDLKSRYEAHAIGRNWGWLSANDIRAMENMNPIENGDTYLSPLNMIPASQSTKEVEQ